VWEWNDAVICSSRGSRGGSWFDGLYAFDATLRSSSCGYLTPDYEEYNVGFRVASVPEPSSALLVMLGGAVWLARKRRRATL